MPAERRAVNVSLIDFRKRWMTWDGWGKRYRGNALAAKGFGRGDGGSPQTPQWCWSQLRKSGAPETDFAFHPSDTEAPATHWRSHRRRPNGISFGFGRIKSRPAMFELVGNLDPFLDRCPASRTKLGSGAMDLRRRWPAKRESLPVIRPVLSKRPGHAHRVGSIAVPGVRRRQMRPWKRSSKRSKRIRRGSRAAPDCLPRRWSSPLR